MLEYAETKARASEMGTARWARTSEGAVSLAPDVDCSRCCGGAMAEDGGAPG